MLKCTHVCFFCSWCCIYKHDLSTSFKKGSKVPRGFSLFHCILEISRSSDFLLLLLNVTWNTKITELLWNRTKFQQYWKTNFLRQQDDPFGILKGIYTITDIVSLSYSTQFLITSFISVETHFSFRLAQNKYIYSYLKLLTFC